MRKSELGDPPLTLPSVPAVPVICDTCRATGINGDPAFAAIPDILDFTPVPRRAHVNNWTPEHQRVFIAALAITGSPRAAARSLGRHAFGAEQLRRAKGGASFADAWDAALDLARERELHRIHANLGALAADQAEQAAAPFDPDRPHARLGSIGHDIDPDDEAARERDHAEALDRIRLRLVRARRLYLSEICDDPARRTAFETLCGPIDWKKTRALEPQDDEPFITTRIIAQPGLMLTAEHGWLAELAGGFDKTEELRRALAEGESTEAKANNDE